MKDVSDPEQVRAAGIRAKQKDILRQNVVKALMENKQTRAWLYDLMEFCGVFQTSFSTSGLLMAQKEGMRNVGLMVLDQLMRSAPQQYVLMLEEAREPDEDDD